MKYVKVITILIIILTFSYVSVFAFSLSEVLTGARGFIKDPGGNVEGEISGIIKSLASAALAIGTIVAVCAGIVIAIQTMANGAEGKAHMKELLTPYIIGIIVLFGAWTIWSIIVNIMESAIQ